MNTSKYQPKPPRPPPPIIRSNKSVTPQPVKIPSIPDEPPKTTSSAPPIPIKRNLTQPKILPSPQQNFPESKTKPEIPPKSCRQSQNPAPHPSPRKQQQCSSNNQNFSISLFPMGRMSRLFIPKLVANENPCKEKEVNNNITFDNSLYPENDCLKCMNFSAVDSHAARFPRVTVTTLENLAFNLTSPFSTKTEKARAIFIWLHHNIAYDTKSFFGGCVRHTNPGDTLTSGLAVCQGYAELFETIGKLAGLEVVVISGHGKGYGFQESTTNQVPVYKSNHAWNAIRLDSGRWHPIDACWGAGYLDSNKQYKKALSTKFFTSSPEVFRRRHFPTKSMHQFCTDIMSWDEYIIMDNGPEPFNALAEAGFSDETIQPTTKQLQAGKATRFLITALCQHAPISKKDQFLPLLNVDGNIQVLKETVPGLVWTCNISSIRRGSSVMLCYLETLNQKSAKGVGAQKYLESCRSSVFTGLCKWDVV